MNSQQELLRRVTQPHRRGVLVALLYITIVAGVGFALLNLKRGTIPLAIAEIVMVAYSVYLLLALRKGGNVDRLTLVYLIPFFTAMMIALLTPNASVTVFGWVLLIPILSHLLLGRFRGLIVSIVFMGFSTVIFWVHYHTSAELMDPRSIANVVVLSFCILACSHAYEMSRERSELQLLRAAHTDFLTGLTNRMGLSEFFDRESKRAQREATPLSFLVIDLDYFKQVNDQFGHEVGDETLVHVATVIKHRLRGTDLLARVGGEEFGVFLVNAGSERARQVAESLCEAVSARPLKYQGIEVRSTISIGVAQLGADGATLQSLMSAADQRLYKAKQNGRNQVVGVTSGEDGNPLDVPVDRESA